MPIAGLTEDKRREVEESTLREMETLAVRIRQLVAAQPPHDLIGYIYGQRLLGAMHEQEQKTEGQEGNSAVFSEMINETQFVLEYVHAVFASTTERGDEIFDEAACAEIFHCATNLKNKAVIYAMMTSAGTNDGVFGPATAEVEFHAKSTWVLLRGNRYQVLEGEFYKFVLTPHDDALRRTYGIGASEIATGFQDMANATREGQANAIEEADKQMKAAHSFAQAQVGSFDDSIKRWAKENPDAQKTAALAFDDMLRGGICNVSRHTKLPDILFEDLSYSRGDETDFFAEGAYCGTPFRTLPARKKPLIKLGKNYYAVDPCFTRDSGYRALLFNLLQRMPDYKKEFEARQKAMSEAAFFQILAPQLKGAKVNNEIWYKDPNTGQWVENDTLIRIDDVLLLIEAKAGATATIASPALDFARHVQAVKDLILKAYSQCKRFFEYLNSANEVPIFERKNGKYVECDRIRLADYRLLLPVGLTVESLSPFSTMCKELPDVTPILGKHSFLSISIDELFVLKRCLPTMGVLAHYLEVRQAVAGMKGVLLFDEFDHLGAYIKQNRFDQTLEEHRAKDRPNKIVWDGMSAIVDRHFGEEDWEKRPVPSQVFPKEVAELLAALDRTRAPGWLASESTIRSYGEEGRNDLAGMLESCRMTLDDHPGRYFQFVGNPSLFIWLQRSGVLLNEKTCMAKASAAALAAKAADMVAILAFADVKQGYISAYRFVVEVPVTRTLENTNIFEDADRMLARQIPVVQRVQEVAPARPPGRNQPCWCGSSRKFKKCHGR